jgi:hypothetical protein
MENFYKYSYWIFGLLLISVFAGFYNSYFGKFPDFEGVTPLMHFHAFMATLWVCVLIIQPYLIKKGKWSLHRTLGKYSLIMVVLVIIATGLFIREKFILNPSSEFSGPFDFRMVGIADLIIFSLSFAFGVLFRKNTEIHSRWMVISGLIFFFPALGRLGIPGPLVIIPLMIAMLIIDIVKRKPYRIFIYGLLLHFLIYPPFLFWINYDNWSAFWNKFF